jgi:dihydroflavonol-4-reductase
MKILITGATGLVGANVAREARAAGHDVRALVRDSSNIAALAGVRVSLVTGDVLDSASLARAAAGCEAVIHCAARFVYHGVTRAELNEVAVEGTRRVVRAASAAGVRRVVVTSSSVVCGYTADRSELDESAQVRGSRGEAYVESKVEQERVAFAEGAASGVDVVAACPAVTIGAHDTRLSPSNSIIITFLRDPLRLTYPGGCNVVSVTDVAHGHLLLLERGVPGTRYLLGSENLTWTDLYRTIADLCGVAGPYFTTGHAGAYLAAATDEWLGRIARRPPLTTRVQAKMVGRYYWYRHTRAAELGYAPRPARAALAEAIAWLAASAHVSRELRASLRLSREVYHARFPEIRA